MPATLTKQQAEFLQSMDTPTVCNVIEMVAPERRGHGYTVKHLFCPFPNLPPIVGFANASSTRGGTSLGPGPRSIRWGMAIMVEKLPDLSGV